ncbi:hypothetical protein HRbin02_00728 [Candidatus Calditenuaceae archaeon HR02]|nr:hypothetical protein HRbin02_00728 [Candidatus Calditenuaceae archaeon HR02]
MERDVPPHTNPRCGPRGKRGDTVILGEILLFAGVVTLGLALWGLSLGYVTSHSTKLTEDYDRFVSRQRGFLIVEAVSLQSNVVWVSNPGLNDAAIISCTIYPKTTPSPGIRYNVRGVIVEASSYRPTALIGCERFPGPPPYTVEVWYISAHLYNPQDPARNSMYALVARYEKG